MGAERGPRGFDALRRLIGAETDQAVRRAFVAAIAQTGPPSAETLLTLARGDADPGLRADAAYHYIRVAGSAGVDSLLAIVERDADDGVRKRAVQGLASLPNDAGVPHLIALARTSKDAMVRKEVVTRLGRTKDPRAIAYLTEILSRGQTRR
jgi:HEAT repeat protein